ncbi:MAG: hypothetical protein CVU71_14890 [Deltaproteobacteria bacterium HGW-Deltaproteobacteria-6]|jgi:ribosomal protein L32|nr:MAG: hypothetical protein CVU71_14890 [Deltaproteobacteria bacterium HGW-Deltaproteobacteria-6]
MEFLIAFAILLLVALIAGLASSKRKETIAGIDANIVSVKECPSCAKTIMADTVVCKYCGTFVCYFWFKS